MDNLFWVSSSHRVEKEKKFARYFLKNFNCILVSDLKISLKNDFYNKAFKEFLRLIKNRKGLPSKRINLKIFAKVIFQDLIKSNFNVMRFIWFSYRVLWISSFEINYKDIFIFRGLNDPLIKYLKLTYSKNYIYLLPHGTNFIDPIHDYWKFSDYWVTDYKKFKIKNISTKILNYGRLDYFDIARHKVHNKILKNSEIKNIGIIFPHTKINLMKSQIYEIKRFLKLLDINPNLQIRPHPGDKQSITYLFKNEMGSELSLDEFINKSEILLFPNGHNGLVSNLYYDCSFRGKVSAAIISRNYNESKYIQKNLIFGVDLNIIRLDKDIFINWFSNLSNIGYSNKIILNQFTNSIKIREKLLKHFLDH